MFFLTTTPKPITIIIDIFQVFIDFFCCCCCCCYCFYCKKIYQKKYDLLPTRIRDVLAHSKNGDVNNHCDENKSPDSQIQIVETTNKIKKQKKNKQKKTRLLKLANKGSTCYISSTIQLMYCAHLHSSSLLFSLFNITPLATSLSSLFSSYSSSSSLSSFASSDLSISISSSLELSTLLLVKGGKEWNRLVEVIFEALPQFKRSEQSDSAKLFEEIMRYLLKNKEIKDEDLILCKNPVLRSFGCNKCEKKEERKEEGTAYLIYSGADDDKSNFSKEFRSQFEWEIGECDDHQTIQYQSCFYSHLPSILFIQLNSPPSFLFQNSSLFLPSHQREEEYELIGMSIFFGDSSIGHYISYIKLINIDNYGFNWYECNDDDVNLIDGNIEDILSFKNNCSVQLALFRKITDPK